MSVGIIAQVIRNQQDMDNVLAAYEEHPPLAAAFDTEGSGLNIVEDTPFLFQFGWDDGNNIYTNAIDIEHTPHAQPLIAQWHEQVKTAPVYLAHNIKFDLHMLANIDTPYQYDNISDTMFYIRFAHDNVSQRQGGVGLGLKDYCAKYIDPAAKQHDKRIQSERMQIAKTYNNQLKQKLGWRLNDIDAFFSDSTNTMEDFPNIRDYVNYVEWKNSLPRKLRNVWGKVTTNDVPYNLVNRETVIEYGLMDIVWTLRLWRQTAPVVEARGNQEGLRRENQCIRPLWEMERQGLSIDSSYVNIAYDKMRQYIREKRQELIDRTGREITVNQNKELLKFFNDTGLPITSTGVEVLNRIHKERPDYAYQDVVDLVLELRTLEKWMSTYLMRFKDVSKIYTQINQVGAASLRMSSDFQQFPKSGISTADGKELFNPRRAVKVPSNVDSIVYLDYSQIELRVQALYTILVEDPDLNLCRAYMPYKCRSDVGLFEFDYTKPDHIKHWNTGEWVHLEDMEKWTPVDVHGATTKAAFNITEDHPEFHDLRYLGKRVNFAKNYGAQRKKIAEMFPDYDDRTIRAIDEGYYKAFPGIKTYQQYCYTLANVQAYATNLFGVRYWNVSGHNLINMLIQGSSATLLKEKIVEMHEFLKDYKSRMLMPIHDEVQFLMYDDEMHIIPKLKEIMEDWDVYVPIVADAEITRTTWNDKEEFDWTENYGK